MSWKSHQYEVWRLEGGCRFQQGAFVTTADEAVIWILRSDGRGTSNDKVIAYFEGNVAARSADGGHDGRLLEDSRWIARFETRAGVELNMPLQGETLRSKPAIVSRAIQAGAPRTTGPWESEDESEEGWRSSDNVVHDKDVMKAQFAQDEPAQDATPFGDLVRAGVRRIQVFPRSNVRWQAKTIPSPDDPSEQVVLISSGVQILIEGPESIGTVSIETDRVVAWTSRFDLSDIATGGIPSNGPVELYLEGNIVFRQGDRIVYADRMYYNVNQEYGVVLGAELITPLKDYQGIARLKADVLQQVDRQNFQAYGAAITTSRLGVPRYWVQSERVSFQDNQRPATDAVTAEPRINPETGEPEVEHDLLATSRNNFVYVSEFPFLYWPFLATDLKRPSYYLNSATVKSDRVYGLQLLTEYDAYQLLGFQKPVGHDWTFSFDTLAKRGLGVGSTYKYRGDTILGIPGPYTGFLDGWGIQDRGLDNLGFGRRDVPLEEKFRGRLLGRHRQDLLNGFVFSGELGLISDRNFLEQYYEREYDTLKDQSTGIELKQYLNAGTWSVNADVRLNDFFTQTEWLPKLDHFVLGQDLLGERLTWTAHSQAGYGKFKTAKAPTNPVDLPLFQPLAWESEQEGMRLATRHEVDLPLELGPVKIVPFVGGEAAYWGNDINGDSIGRLLGQAGLRTSLPMWRVDPTIRSDLFNLNGLAHKVTFEGDLLYADASQDLTRFPLYDAIDDDSTEQFRRRFQFLTFGAPPIPTRFDERFYAFRTGLQENVTSPSVEIADDLMVAKLGILQRWQTKRGAAGQERIVDWITLDAHASLFPRQSRDNFGEVAGLIDYDLRWHVGDRFSILSTGFADVFDQGLRQVTLGGLLNRPDMGSVYLGFRSTEGPITSQVLVASFNYRSSEKWIANAATTIDFSRTGNIGQTFSMTRVGEAFLIRLGAGYDASRNNFHLFFGVEPRFLPGGRLGIVGGAPIPPAGTLGLE